MLHFSPEKRNIGPRCLLLEDLVVSFLVFLIHIFIVVQYMFKNATIVFFFTLPFFSKIDVKLYFHGPDQFLDLSGRMGYKLYKGEIMQSQITVTDITILERDVKEDKNDPNYKKGQKTCSKELYDDCIYNMLARTMREDTKDNCTVPYIRDDSNICTNPQVFGFCQN